VVFQAAVRLEKRDPIRLFLSRFEAYRHRRIEGHASGRAGRCARGAILPTLLALAAAGLPGCNGEYLPVALTPGGQMVQVSADDPPEGCTEIGPVEGSHGTQCNAFGRSGTRDGAVNVLRNAAASRGADYVRIDREIPPDPPRDNCLFKLRGTGYRCCPPGEECAPPPP
jgi:hypothetical protein